MQVSRFLLLDAARGVAMVWMTLFHLCFDLNTLRVIHQDFHHDPLWTWQRTCILGLFLLCAGAGQAAAQAQGQSWRQFGRRWLRIVVGAGAVSVGSWWMFPNTYIYFGVLHGMAVMLLLVRVLGLLRWSNGLWVALAMGLIATHLIAGHALSMHLSGLFGIDLNSPAWNWLGWVSRLPVTQDYVPLVPWLGVMMLGFAGMQRWLHTHAGRPPGPHTRHSAPARGGRVVAGLAKLGQWSLGYYLLHQPVLLGALWLLGVGR